MGTFGNLLLGSGEDQARLCYTLELPWRDNAPRVSCIPCGTYPLRYDFYNRGGYACWEIYDVPGRDEIKIHIGNVELDILGCVVLGTALGWIKKRGQPKSKWAVTSSGVAFRRFMEVMEPFSEATITILNQTP